jgi:hypothetical protein
MHFFFILYLDIPILILKSGENLPDLRAIVKAEPVVYIDIENKKRKRAEVFNESSDEEIITLKKIKIEPIFCD